MYSPVYSVCFGYKWAQDSVFLESKVGDFRVDPNSVLFLCILIQLCVTFLCSLWMVVCLPFKLQVIDWNDMNGWPGSTIACSNRGVFFVFSLKTGTLPLASQESMIVEDLLYVLIGVDGRYITAQPLVGRQNRAFSVDPNLDLSIKELVTRILPVAASYSAVTRYQADLCQRRMFSFV